MRSPHRNTKYRKRRTFTSVDDKISCGHTNSYGTRRPGRLGKHVEHIEHYVLQKNNGYYDNSWSDKSEQVTRVRPRIKLSELNRYWL